ncbi:hypothetical protein LCGC14_2796720, partial [marine sediment metagenome]
SMWLSTDDQMKVVARLADSIVSGKNPKLREEWLTKSGGNQALHKDLTPEDRDLINGDISIRGNVAIVPIHGAITPKANMMMAYSGGVSAELLTTNINTLTAREDIKYIVLDVDSNGGSVHGLEAAAIAIRNARKVKRVFAIAQYNMNSAAYWIASAAEKIFVTPTSVVGSIGVVSILHFAGKKEKKRTVILRSVPGKLSINKFEPLSDDARRKLQSDIDTIHASFVEAVSLNRKIDMSKAKKLANGETSLGAKAVTAGLADKEVENLDAVLAEIDAIESLETRVETMRGAFQALDVERLRLTADLVTVNTELTDLKAEMATADTAAADVKFTAAVDAAIEDGKIPAGLKEEWLSDLRSGTVSFDAFTRIVGNISAGTVVPEKELDPVNPEADSSNDSAFPTNDLERALFA